MVVVCNALHHTDGSIYHHMDGGWLHAECVVGSVCSITTWMVDAAWRVYGAHHMDGSHHRMYNSHSPTMVADGGHLIVKVEAV